MIRHNVTVRNADDWVRAFKRMPERAATGIIKALTAGLAEYDKIMVDPAYDFVTPRRARTGHMALRKFQEINPTTAVLGHQVNYAYRVYRYHKQRGNDFMERFTRRAKPKVEEHFEDALDEVVRDTANDARL